MDPALPGPRDVNPYQWSRPLDAVSLVSLVDRETVYDREIALVETADLYAQIRKVCGPLLIWWTIDLWGFETWRSAVPAGAMPAKGPVTAWQAGQNEFPVGGVWPGRSNSGIRTSRAKMRVTYDGGVGVSRWVDVDVGPGRPFSILAPYVRVGLLVPAGTVRKRPTNPPILVPGPGQSCVDMDIAGHVTGSYAPGGNRHATLSQRLVVADNQSRTVQIPPAATSLRVWQTSTGTIQPLRWIQGVPSNQATPSAATLGPELGSITFRPGQRNTEEVSVPGLATHVASEATDAPTGRDLLFVWGISP